MNTGGVGLPYDGDWRPAYVLIDDGVATIPRVEYDLEAERRASKESGFPPLRVAERSSVKRTIPEHRNPNASELFEGGRQSLGERQTAGDDAEQAQLGEVRLAFDDFVGDAPPGTPALP